MCCMWGMASFLKKKLHNWLMSWGTMLVYAMASMLPEIETAGEVPTTMDIFKLFQLQTETSQYIPLKPTNQSSNQSINRSIVLNYT